MGFTVLFCVAMVMGFTSVHWLCAWLKYRFVLSKWTPPRRRCSKDYKDGNADDSKQAAITEDLPSRNVEIVSTYSTETSTRNEHKTQIALEVPPVEETLSE